MPYSTKTMTGCNAPTTFRIRRHLSTLCIWAALVGVGWLSVTLRQPSFSIEEKSLSANRRRRLMLQGRRSRPIRVLYTITTLSEYDSGTRATVKGHDRMQNTLIPIMMQTVTSLLDEGYEVDVFIVAHFHMTREHLLREALPDQVGLRIWDDAAPLTYDPGKRDDPNGKIRNNTLGLARQHRMVIRDNLMDYDFFMSFEDDMILKGAHVTNHIEMTRQLFEIRRKAPDTSDDQTTKKPVGTLSKDQLKRILPGIIRVEVLLNETEYGTQPQLDPVPVQSHPPLEAETCCHLRKESVNANRPQSPSSDKVFLWETGILGLGVRYLPELGTIAFQRGPALRDGEHNISIADYWSGADGYFGEDRRPRPGDFSFINNQGGWMATQQQIWEWNNEVCHGGLLPPFDSPHFNFDGTDARNVEWWSGGMGLFTARHGCNMQRILSLDHDKFSKHLIYHSANNKQRQLHWKRKSFVKIDDLYGQLLTVKNNYEKKYDPIHQ